jgi:hypothetical protein
MTDKFNLSEKILRFPKMGYEEKDVKEFIRLLKNKINPKKEIINELCCPCCLLKKELLSEIDKLAGDKLI